MLRVRLSAAWLGRILQLVLVTQVASFADFYLLDPFGSEHLVCCQTAARNRIQNGVNDIAALTLRIELVTVHHNGMHTGPTLFSISIGLKPDSSLRSSRYRVKNSSSPFCARRHRCLP